MRSLWSSKNARTNLTGSWAYCGWLIYEELALLPSDSPHLSDRSENICEQRLLMQRKGETLHQRTQPGFRHRRDQIVKHAALTEQRMDAALGGVGLEHPIIAQRLAGGAEQGQQHHRESVDQP